MIQVKAYDKHRSGLVRRAVPMTRGLAIKLQLRDLFWFLLVVSVLCAAEIRNNQLVAGAAHEPGFWAISGPLWLVVVVVIFLLSGRDAVALRSRQKELDRQCSLMREQHRARERELDRREAELNARMREMQQGCETREEEAGGP